MKGFILDYVFGWLAVLIGIFLTTKYLFRKLVRKLHGEKNLRLVKINRSLRIPHIVLGFVLIGIGLIHGAHSSDAVLSMNIGTINWLVTIVFGISWLGKNLIKRKWMLLHQTLTILFVVTLVWHIIDVGGINIFRVISEMNSDVTYETVLDETLVSGAQDPKEGNQQFNEKETTSSTSSSFNEKELPYYFSFKGLNLADGTYYNGLRKLDKEMA